MAVPSQRPVGQPARSAASANQTVVSAERSGTLRLTADPDAEVSIDGEGIHQTRNTPVRALALKPGSYQVSFRNATYGPPIRTTLTLTTGGTRSVHVDFRELKPRVTVK